jgi:hypothetical protein
VTVRRSLTLVLAAVLAISLGACGGDDSIETGAPEASGAGGGGDGSGTPGDRTVVPPDRTDPPPDAGGGSPADAFRACQQLGKKGDDAGLYECLSKGSKSQLGQIVDQWRSRVLQAAQMNRQAVESDLRSEFGMGLDELQGATTKDLSIRFLGLGLKEDSGVLDATIVGEPVVEGNRATVTYREKDGSTDTADMVREDGAWKLDLDFSDS